MHLILISTLCVLRARHYFLVVGTSSVLEFQFGVCLAGKTPFFQGGGYFFSRTWISICRKTPVFQRGGYFFRHYVCTSAVILIEVDASCGQDTPFWWVLAGWDPTQDAACGVPWEHKGRHKNELERRWHGVRGPVECICRRYHTNLNLFWCMVGSKRDIAEA